MPKNKGGRPSLLTKEVQDAIAEAILAGCTIKDACLSAGVSYWDYNNWMKRGQKDTSGEYFNFFQTIKKAEAAAKARMVKRIDQAGEKSWQAHAWLLERRFPDEFGRRERQDVNMQHSGDVKIVFEDVWPEGKGPKKKSKPEPADKK